jgi:hypothetical protein
MRDRCELTVVPVLNEESSKATVPITYRDNTYVRIRFFGGFAHERKEASGKNIWSEMAEQILMNKTTEVS